MKDTDSKGPGGLHKRWLEGFTSHRPLIAHVVGRIVQPDEVEDILQDTFVNSYAAARKQKVDNQKAFMLKIAKNLALNHINRSEVRLNSSLNDFDEADLRLISESTEELTQSNEKFLTFCRAVATLPLACRRVFILRKVYGLTQKETAEDLNISPSTVEKHVAKGMYIAAKYMQDQGYSFDTTKKMLESKKGKGK